MIMRCVVCGEPAREEHHANTWERSRKRYPCCSPACAELFDEDQHWLPARFPEPATDDDVGRLTRVARKRIADGDRPVIIVRELLLAGVPVERVRGVMIDMGSRAERDHAETRKAGRWATFLALFSPGLGVKVAGHARRRDASQLADADAAGAAYGAIEQWQRATGGPVDPTDPAPLPPATAKRAD